MEELTFLSLSWLLSFGNKMFIFLVALAALIFVHELGHFLVARRFGVVVEKFSLGFGPKLLSYQSGETEYIIAAIPLGGYVKMKGEDPGEELKDSEGSFSAAPVKSRIAIAFAGPAFNILFAILIYIIFYMIGTNTLSSTIGEVRDQSPAQAAGIQTGDKIVEVNGEKIRFWDELLKIVHAAPGQKLEFMVERNKKTLLNFSITPVAEEITNLIGQKERVGLIGVMPLVHNVSIVEEGSPAEKAGLKVGDKIISVDGTPIRGWADMKTAALDKPGQELEFKFERDGNELTVRLTPDKKEVKDEKGKKITLGVLGIGMGGEMVREQYGPVGATLRGLEVTGEMTYLTMMGIKAFLMGLLTGSVPKDQLGGPILIFQIYGEVTKQGFNELIRLTALLSISLGLLNLLPIPILDGGHILFFLIEIVKGKPVSEKNRERAAQVGLFMLLSLMVFVFYWDIMRIIG